MECSLQNRTPTPRKQTKERLPRVINQIKSFLHPQGRGKKQDEDRNVVLMQLPLHARKLCSVSCQETGESAVVRERCCRVCRGKSLINQCLPFTPANSILEQVRRHNGEVSCFRPSCRCYITWITTHVISCPWHKSFALSRVQTDDESFKSHCRADQSHALDMPPSFLQVSPCGQTDLLCAWSSVEGTQDGSSGILTNGSRGEGRSPVENPPTASSRVDSDLLFLFCQPPEKCCVLCALFLALWEKWSGRQDASQSGAHSFWPTSLSPHSPSPELAK